MRSFASLQITTEKWNILFLEMYAQIRSSHSRSEKKKTRQFSTAANYIQAVERQKFVDLLARGNVGKIGCVLMTSTPQRKCISTPNRASRNALHTGWYTKLLIYREESLARFVLIFFLFRPSLFLRCLWGGKLLLRRRRRLLLVTAAFEIVGLQRGVFN